MILFSLIIITLIAPIVPDFSKQWIMIWIESLKCFRFLLDLCYCYVETDNLNIYYDVIQINAGAFITLWKCQEIKNDRNLWKTWEAVD